MINGMINRVKELSGIYSLGFDRESFMGLMIPIGLVVIVGGIGAALVLFLG